MRPLYMLDTSACIQVLRGQAPFDALPACKDTAVSSLVAAELWTGVEKSGRPNKAAALDTFLNLFAVIDFGLEDARHYAQIRADLERKGTPIGPLDLLIAAQTRNLGATLITRNASEFKRVKGLKIQAWK
jgi:tRNA(fMet)-specific endonuclease VapC